MVTLSKKINFIAGDRVRYSRAFLRDISAPELKTRKGTILENRLSTETFPNSPDILIVLWTDSNTPKGCLSSNLEIDWSI